MGGNGPGQGVTGGALGGHRAWDFGLEVNGAAACKRDWRGSNTG